MIRSKVIAHWLLVGIAAVGVFGIARISMGQFTGQAQCPQLGDLPACYVVLACYTLILISAVLRSAIPSWIFWIGWLGVFAMAMTGTVLEIAGMQTCPRTGGGTPTCFYSLGLAILLALLFIASSERKLPDDR